MDSTTVERDYPVGHPASSDYAGQPYTPPPPPLGRDYPVGHPKAADSPANIAESKREAAERSAPGQPGVPIEIATAPDDGKPPTPASGQVKVNLFK